MQQVISSRGEDGGGKQEPDKRKLLKYFLKVVGLFEQASCHLAVLKVAKTAVMCFDKDDTVSDIDSKCTLCLQYWSNRSLCARL